MRNTINLEWPSIAPWITKFHWIKLWWPSICHKLFGPGLLHFLHWTRQAHLILEFTGSTLTKALETLRSCTPSPINERCPRIKDLPQKFPWFILNSFLYYPNHRVLLEKPVWFSMSYSLTLRTIVHLDTNRSSAISFHEHPISRK